MVGAIDISLAVLVVSAIMKLTDASATAALLATLGIGRPGRSSRRIARLTGIAELGVAATMWVLGGRLGAIALAVSYAVFSGVLTVVMRVGSSRSSGDGPPRVISCGCFGARSAPPTTLHLVLNLTSMAAAIVAIVSPIDPLGTRLADLGAAAVPYMMLVTIGAGLVIAAHTVGAEVSAELSTAMRPVRTTRTARPIPSRQPRATT